MNDEAQREVKESKVLVELEANSIFGVLSIQQAEEKRKDFPPCNLQVYRKETRERKLLWMSATPEPGLIEEA